MLRALVGKISGAVFTSSRNPRALSPATLASLAEQLGGPASEIVRDPRQAVDRAPRAGRAGRGGPGHRIDLPGGRPAGRPGAPEGVGAVNERGPSVLAMVPLVAVVVALVILVFFAIGYAFGRAFL